MRQHYIDNLRNLGILLLIPYHTCMIYNGFESFYIHGSFVKGCSGFILLTGLWFMPLLFFLSGISAYLSLERRTWKVYLNERFFKLFIPLIFGVLLIIPIQTFYAEKFHNNFQGSYVEQYKLFFTKITDLTGYTGGFTPGHLWFLFYLFVIAIITLPVMLKVKKSSNSVIEKFNNPFKLMLLFILPFILSPVLDIGGKSLGGFSAIVFLGFILYKQEGILLTIEKYKALYLILAFFVK